MLRYAMLMILRIPMLVPNSGTDEYINTNKF